MRHDDKNTFLFFSSLRVLDLPGSVMQSEDSASFMMLSFTSSCMFHFMSTSDKDQGGTSYGIECSQGTHGKLSLGEKCDLDANII